MTPAARAAIRAFMPGRVSYTPGCFDKRFARQMAEAVEYEPDWQPTERQWQQIRRIAHRYRRQVPQSVHTALCLDCGVQPVMSGEPVPARRLPLFELAPDDMWDGDLTGAQERGLASVDYYDRCEHDEEPDSDCPYCAGRACYHCRLHGQPDEHPPCSVAA